MDYKILDELSTITGIAINDMTKLFDNMSLCVCNDVLESIHSGEDVCELNIGIGKLILRVDDNEIMYKFIPSSQLENDLINTIKNNSSPLIQHAENCLCKRFNNTYKELL